MLESLRGEIASIKERDPAARSGIQVFLLYSGFHALIYYRIAHWFHTKANMPGVARWVSQRGRFRTGIEIHPGATIGKGLFIDHGMGVVIGETAEIGDNVTIYQGVTLGGTGKDVGKRHPTIGNDVVIGAGAKVLGPFKVGDGAKVAAGAVVLNEVPANATAVGIPAHVVRLNGEKVNTKPEKNNSKKNICKNTADLDQIHIPDPVEQEICQLMLKIERLTEKVKELEGKIEK